MKNVIAASLMVLTLGATAATADVKVGLGFGIDAWSSLSGPLDGGTTPQTTIRVPIDFDMGLRIEPELGFTFSENEDNTEKNKYKGVTLAVGAYYNFLKVDKVNIYAGGRLGLSKGKHEFTNKNNGASNYTNDVDAIALQGLVGAEYFFVENMSFAAQAGVELRSATESRADYDETSTGTVSTLIIRYFF
jgi:opacity protein-like surface antigen